MRDDRGGRLPASAKATAGTQADLFRLDGRVAVVTGALGILGPVWTKALLDAGASVVGLDLPGAQPNAAFAALQSAFGDTRLTLLPGSVTDCDALLAARDHVRSTSGAADVLVNNAGVDQPPSPSGGGYLLEDIPFDVNRRISKSTRWACFRRSRCSALTW